MKNIFIFLFLLLSVYGYAQRYELYTGVSSNTDKVLGNGYMAGLNFIMDMNQRADREWANRMLFGFEHSGYYSDKVVLSDAQGGRSQVSEDCDCENTVYNSESDRKVMRRLVRGVSLNFGIEAYKGLYMLTGVTTYNHIMTVNTLKAMQYRATHLDFGVKYYIKYNNWFFSPTVKFNPESISYGIGVSWNHL